MFFLGDAELLQYEKAVALWQRRGIHPFADGNGRVGRLVMNYWLILNDHPPVIIHEEDRKGYYDALEAWDDRQELDPLVRYLKVQLEKTWDKQIQRQGA